jgi:hypothetical protein
MAVELISKEKQVCDFLMCLRLLQKSVLNFWTALCNTIKL